MIAKHIRRLWEHFLDDSLFRNSIYLMLNTGIQAAFGFFFWLICARIYNPTDVGLATSLLAAASLTSTFSMLGFNNVIVRFLPTSEHKNEQLSTAFTLTAIASFLAGMIFLVWAVGTHNPSVQFSQPIFLFGIFIASVLVTTINSILESAFIAYRSAKYILYKNFALSVLKLMFVIILATFIARIGFPGIVGLITLLTLFTFLLGYLWLIIKFKYRPTVNVDTDTIRETKRFAAGNYLGTLFGALPSTVLMLIVVSRLSAQDAAFFYIPSMIVVLLNVIPSSMAQSLFAEVSHDESGFARYVKNALKNMFAFLIPSVIAIWFLADFVLRFFGANYAAYGAPPLRILALASLIGSANYIGDTLLNIKKKSGMYLFMNALNAIAVVVPAYIFAPEGLVAIGWAVLFGQLVTAIIYLAMNWRFIISLRARTL